VSGRKIRREWTPARKKKFLEALAAGGTVALAVKAADMSRAAAYDLRNKAPDFDAAWNDAFETGTDLLEQEAERRALGWAETRYAANGEAYEIFKCSDVLLIFMLKARRPEKFRERMEQLVLEQRRIVIDLVKVVTDPESGRLVLADDHQPSLLTSGE